MAEDVYSLAAQAFDADAVPALLKGEEPYRVLPDRFLPANVPTDWDRLLRQGVLPCCAQSPERLEQHHRAVADLLAGCAESIWCAYTVYFYLCYADRDEETPSPALERFPVQRLRETLRRSQLSLALCREWNGTDDLGLWADILYADRVLEARCQKGVLKA